MITNLNILGPDGKVFKYIVECLKTDVQKSTILEYENTPNSCWFKSTEFPTICKGSYWIDNQGVTTDFLPNNYYIYKLSLFFPRFSVDTYVKKFVYQLDVCTWVNGHKISLFSGIVKRSDSLAITTGPRKFLNDDYYECFETEIVSPHDLIYGDAWKNFRANICDEPTDLNNSGSNIGINLVPVVWDGEKYVKLSGYEGAQSSLLLSQDVRDCLHGEITTNVNVGTQVPSILCKLHYNEVYETIQRGFAEYLQETYLLDPTKLCVHYKLLVRDRENVYKYIEKDYNTLAISTAFTKGDLNILSWDEYKDGLFLEALCLVYDKDDIENEIIGFTTNSIYLTPDLFKYFVISEGPNHINLDQVNMQNIQIDAVNKVIKQVVQLDRPSDYKANIIKPIFYRSQDAALLTLHPAVTEHICLNLDAYKNKVDNFLIKIGDMSFGEISRTNAGVIFKIVGSKLPSTPGTYYIINKDGELITTGQYELVS